MPASTWSAALPTRAPVTRPRSRAPSTTSTGCSTASAPTRPSPVSTGASSQHGRRWRCRRCSPSAKSSGAFDVWRRDGLDGRRRFDPSGVVKGWALERATAHLRLLDDTDFCLSGCGDLVALVTDPDRPEWQVGIENPAAPDTLLARVQMREGAVATSSPAHRGTHIVDARTGAAAGSSSGPTAPPPRSPVTREHEPPRATGSAAPRGGPTPFRYVATVADAWRLPRLGTCGPGARGARCDGKRHGSGIRR